MAITEFTSPFDWPTIDAQVATRGAVVLKNFLPADQVHALNSESDLYIEARRLKDSSLGLPGLPDTQSATYNQFLGHNTIRLHGLLEKLPASARLIGDTRLLDWAERSLAAVANQPRLSALELIQIQPGEPRQAAHRDSDSWPLPLGADPFVVNAIVALTDFTKTNGATFVAPGSFDLPKDHSHSAVDFVQAEMAAGDALLFRGDLIHGAGANNSAEPRRAISISFCAGWLRSVENSALNLSVETVSALAPALQAVLGYAAYDGSSRGNGLLGLYENGDPALALKPGDS